MSRASFGTSKVLYQVIPSDLRETDPRPARPDNSPAVVLGMARTRFGAASDIELMLFGDPA